MKILAIVVGWFHLLAAFTWLGGLIFMNVVLTPAVGTKGIPPQFVRLMGMKRYSPFAWGSIAVLAVTGALKTVANIGSVGNFTTTPYGITLLIKILVVVLMVGVTALNSLVLGPRLMAGAPQPPQSPTPETLKIQKRLVRMSHVNLALGLIVLLLVATLNVAGKG